MKDWKFWVQGYDGELGEFSTGYNDLNDAWADYHDKLNKASEHGGHVEFIEVSQIAFIEYKEN